MSACYGRMAGAVRAWAGLWLLHAAAVKRARGGDGRSAPRCAVLCCAADQKWHGTLLGSWSAIAGRPTRVRMEAV